MTKTIILKLKNSFAYWYNIIFNYGIGMLVDNDNLKRYAYPKINFISIKDTSITIKSATPIKKSTINLSLSLPFTTVFNINDSSGKYNSEGVFGLKPVQIFL